MIKSEVTIRPFRKVIDRLLRKIAEKLLKSVEFSCIDHLMELL